MHWGMFSALGIYDQCIGGYHDFSRVDIISALGGVQCTAGGVASVH